MAELVAAQYGVFSRAQAMRMGMSRSAVQRRIGSGRWELVHPGVIREPGAPRSWHQALAAACLAWEGRAAISHRSAAALRSLPGFDPGIVEVVLPKTARRRLEGIVQHRPRVLVPADISRVGVLRVTTVARTLVDLGAVASRELLEEALDDALRRGLVSIPRLRSRLGDSGRVKGIHVIRSLVEARSSGSGVPESVLETRLLRLLDKALIVRPSTQYEVRHAGRRVAVLDFAFPDARLGIEADGYRWHSGKGRWERDLHRRNALMALGWRILHVTWGDLHDRPGEVVETVRAMLDGPGPP
jgi:REase_MTES_1575